jgi:hypothetical protein
MKHEKKPTPPKIVPSPENVQQCQEISQPPQDAEELNQLSPASRGPLQRRADAKVSAAERDLAAEVAGMEMPRNAEPTRPLQTCGDIEAAKRALKAKRARAS